MPNRLSSTPFALFSVGPGRWALKASTVVVMGSNPVVDRIKEQGCPDCGSHRVRAGMDERDDLVSLVSPTPASMPGRLRSHRPPDRPTNAVQCRSQEMALGVPQQ